MGTIEEQQRARAIDTASAYEYGRRQGTLPGGDTPTLSGETNRLLEWGQLNKGESESQAASDLGRLQAIGSQMSGTNASQQQGAQALGQARGANMGIMAGNTLDAGQNYGRTFADLGRGAGQAGTQARGEYNELANQYGEQAAGVRQQGQDIQGQFGNLAAGLGDVSTGYQGAANRYAAGDVTTAGGQQAAIDRLRGWSEQGPGPSAAQAQLAAAQDANMASAIALSRSGRGVGGGALAERQAAFQNAATQQQTGQQAAVLRAQEEQAWRGQQLNAMGLEQQGLGQMRQQGQGMYGTAVGAQQTASGQQLAATQAGGQLGATYEGLAQGAGGQQLAAREAGTNAALQYGQLGQGYRQMGANTELGFGAQAQGYNQLGQQTELGWANLGQGYGQLGQQGQLSAEQLGAQTGLGYNTLGQQAYQFGEGERQKAYATQLAADTGQLSSQTQRDIANMQQSSAETGALMSAAGAALPFLFSDERSKKQIADAEAEIQRLHEVIGGVRKDLPSAAPTGTMSYGNTNAKSWMPYGYVDNGYEAPTGSMHEKLSPSSYQYKNPSAEGAAPGTHYGPMAQDLERTPAGRSTVIDTPQGKQVDTGRLAMATASEAGSLERRLQRLEEMLGGAR